MALEDTVDIFRLRYTQAELVAVPEPERMFYLLATGLANDLQILIRQYTIAVKQWEEDKVKRDGSSAVAMLNLRLLAGRFHEGWYLIRDRWKILEADYEDQMTAKGKQALAELRQHFDVSYQQNIVRMVRDKIGFHSEYGYAKMMLDAVPSDTEMVEYIGEMYGDTLYFGSEVTHYRTLQTITGAGDDVEAFGKVMDEVRKLQNLFLTFINAMVRAFATRHFAKQFANIRSEKHTLTGLPRFDDLQIPFFADFSGSLARVEDGTSPSPE